MDIYTKLLLLTTICGIVGLGIAYLLKWDKPVTVALFVLPSLLWGFTVMYDNLKERQMLYSLHRIHDSRERLVWLGTPGHKICAIQLPVESMQRLVTSVPAILKWPATCERAVK
jgi:hypothetical protein